MQYIRIKEWDKYQHYKDRNPPWIKLHRELITSMTWVALDDASRVLAVACMMLAAGTDNKIPANKGYLRRVAYLNSDPDWQPLLEVNFIEIIEDSNNTLADASTLQADARPETETETEKRQSKKRFTPPTLQEIQDYCRERSNDVDPQKFLDHYEANGWMRGKTKIKDWKACVRTWEQSTKSDDIPETLRNWV